MLTPEEEAKKLVAMGYRRISNKYRIVSRVDRPDWKEFLAKDHSPWNLDQGRKWVSGMGDGSAADFYRRCRGRDHLTVTADVFKFIPPSGFDPCGYIPVDKPGL